MIPESNLLRTLIMTVFTNLAPYDFTNDVEPNAEYDFVVVGAGAAGSVVAGRLAETNATVLVMEAGPSATEHFPEMNVAGSPWSAASATIVNSLSGQFKVGQVMGGGTTVNNMAFMKGSRGDFDNWAQLGNEGWDFDSILPYYKKLENYSGSAKPEDEYLFGRSGPVGVSQVEPSSHFKKLLETVAHELNYKIIDQSHPDKIGFSFARVNAKDGMRFSSSESYLRPVVKQSNILVKTKSRVTKILFDENKRAYAVQYSSDGKTKTVKVNKEVILSAGAINSPKILMLSGVGPKDHLADVGIPLIEDVPGVGENLKDHPGSSALVWLGEKSSRKKRDVLQDLKTFNETRQGPLATSHVPPATFYANVNDGDNPTWPDMFYFMIQMSRAFTVIPHMCRPDSSGNIKLNSSDPLENPIIDFKFLSNSKDIETLAKGLSLAHRVGESQAIQGAQRSKFTPKSRSKDQRCKSRSRQFSIPYWECIVKAYIEPSNHASGTCKMAPNSDPMGVVSPRLRVRGVTGVRVVDASIMPQVVSVNPVNTIMMIGEKAADMIKQDWGLEENEKRYIYLDRKSTF